MTEAYQFFATGILLTVFFGLGRVFWGPTRADRMLAAQICATAMVAVLLLLAGIREQDYLLDIALVFAVLTAITTVAFVRLIWRAPGSLKPEGDDVLS